MSNNQITNITDLIKEVVNTFKNLINYGQWFSLFALLAVLLFLLFAPEL